MKTLKPGPRPFFAFGTICVLMFLMPLYLGFSSGKWTDAGKMAGCLLILPVLMLGPIVSVRVEVDEEEIRLLNFGRIRKRVRFQAIGYSYASVLAEKDWPVSLKIMAEDIDGKEEDEDSVTTELMSVGLKIFRKEDVTWLLSLPQLKIRRYMR